MALVVVVACRLQLSLRRQAWTKLRPVVLELLVTERNYVRMLQHIENTFVFPLQEGHGATVSPIFACWSQLRALHVQLLEDFAEACLDHHAIAIASVKWPSDATCLCRCSAQG